MKLSRILKLVWMKEILVRSSMATKLLEASKTGDAQELKTILNSIPSLVKFKYYKGKNTPLHIAAARGNVEIVEILLQCGANVNALNGARQTPLMLACRLGHMTIVKILLLYNAQTELVDEINGCNALHYAAGSGYVECLRLCLADYIPSVPPSEGNIKVSYSDVSRLHQYPSRTLHEIVNSRADGGITALHLASFYGKFECVRLLLNLGAWVDAISVCDAALETDVIGNHSSALHFAAFSGSFDCCQILLTYGADRTKRNANGWTPSDVAKIRRHHLLYELLLANSTTTATFPPSKYLAYPLMSIITIAREIGLEGKDMIDVDTSENSSHSVSRTMIASTPNNLSENDTDNNYKKCGICLEQNCIVKSSSCKHQLCCHCALQLCLIQSSSPSTTPITMQSSSSTSNNSFLASSSNSNMFSDSSSSTSMAFPDSSTNLRTSLTSKPFIYTSFMREREDSHIYSHATASSSSSSSSSSSMYSLAGTIPCPFCRTPITSFEKLRSTNDDGMVGNAKDHDCQSSRELNLVDWLSLKLPNGKSLLEENQELDESSIQSPKTESQQSNYFDSAAHHEREEQKLRVQARFELQIL